MPGIKGVTYYRATAGSLWLAPGRPGLDPGDLFVLGVTKPTAANTGLTVTEASLETLAGGTYNTPNQVIENKRFTSTVNVRAANVTFRNCYFAVANSVALNCNDASVSNLLIERCKFRPSTPGSSSYGPFGRNYTLLRCDLSGSIDTCSIIGSSTANLDLNVKLYGNYSHDMLYTSPNPNHSDNQSHSDAIQIHYGGNNIDIFGNTVTGMLDPTIGNANEPARQNGDGTHAGGNKYYPNMAALSAIIASPVSTTAGLNNVTVRKNWMGGGAAVVNWPRSDGTNISFTDNRWTRGTRLGDDYVFLMNAAQVATITGNVYDDNDVPFNARKNG